MKIYEYLRDSILYEYGALRKFPFITCITYAHEYMYHVHSYLKQ